MCSASLVLIPETIHRSFKVAVLIALIDRIRMLDNDIIRLKSKVNTVIEYKEREKLLGSKKSAPKQKS